MNKEAALADLKKQYGTPGAPLAFGGINLIKRYYGNALSIKDIENFLAGSRSYTLHREFKRPKYNPFYCRKLRQQFQVDLIEIRQVARYNNNFNYILVCTDIFSRYLWARLLRRKTGEETLQQFQDILNEAKTLPKTLHVDRGAEMRNKLFKNFCAEKNIEIIYPNSSHHAPHIERLGKSLQMLIYKYITSVQNFTFYHKLQDFVRTYNTRMHRSIGMTPEQGELPENSFKIIQMHEKKYAKILKTKKIKYSVGDQVRFSKLKNHFTRSYNAQSQEEIMKVSRVFTHLPRVMYELTSLSGEKIEGKFYQEELTLIKNQDEFLIEKVLKKKGKKILVKWVGYGPEQNSWIDENDITSIKDFQT